MRTSVVENACDLIAADGEIDADGALTRAMRLPTMEVGGMTLLRRLTMVVRDGTVEQVFYPVFPPDAAAATVLEWLRQEA